MGELRSKTEITPELLKNVADTCNVIKCNPRELGRDEIYEILMECYVTQAFIDTADFLVNDAYTQLTNSYM